MEKVGIFYGPVGGSTERVAKKLADIFGDSNADLMPVSKSSVDDLAGYSNIIFGIATIGNETWNSEPVKSGWFSFMNELEKANLSGKKIALFGLGDHIRYAEHFVDAMGELNRLIADKGLTSIGRVPSSDYTFTDSKALEGDMFVGLPIDEDFEQSLTDERIKTWTDGLRKEFT